MVLKTTPNRESSPEELWIPHLILVYSFDRILAPVVRLALRRGDTIVSRSMEELDLVADDLISRQEHAAVHWDGKRAVSVAHLHGKHHTLVDGDPVGKIPRALRDGARIEIGQSLFVLRFLPPVPLDDWIEGRYQADSPELERVREILWQDLIGESPCMQKVRSQVFRAAQHDHPVLIHGETGIGKTAIAKPIHLLSSRRQGPYVEVDGTMVDGELGIDSLFGHQKGAFTGAVTERAGAFGTAHKGTLLLDELGCLPMVSQGKLLKVLQSGAFARSGADVPIQVDIRLISATNRPLVEMAEQERFRADLLHRIVGDVIEPAPLRERSDDLFLLMASKLNDQMLPYGIAKELFDYAWPGNVRQALNVAALLAAHKKTTGKYDGAAFKKLFELSPKTKQPAAQVREPTPETVCESLARNSGNQEAVAKEFSLKKYALRKLLDRWEIDLSSFKKR